MKEDRDQEETEMKKETQNSVSPKNPIKKVFWGGESYQLVQMQLMGQVGW